MERITNVSVAALTARLVTQMTEDGFSPSATENVISLAAQLSDFMELRAVVTYDERAGKAFLEDRSRHVAKSLFSIFPRIVCAAHFQPCRAVFDLEMHPVFLEPDALFGKKSAVKPAHFVILNKL